MQETSIKKIFHFGWFQAKTNEKFLKTSFEAHLRSLIVETRIFQNSLIQLLFSPYDPLPTCKNQKKKQAAIFKRICNRQMTVEQWWKHRISYWVWSKK